MAPLSDTPWLPPDCIEWLSDLIHSGEIHKVLEFGCGGSTVWFAGLSCIVHTFDKDVAWGAAVMLAGCPVTIAKQPYNAVLSRVPENWADLVLVDGRDRVKCVQSSEAMVRPGGWLLLDNAERDRYKPIFHMLRKWPTTVFECHDKKERGCRYSEKGVWRAVAWRRPK